MRGQDAVDIDGNDTGAFGALHVQFEGSVRTLALHPAERDAAEGINEPAIFLRPLGGGLLLQQLRRIARLGKRLPGFRAAAVDGLDDGIDQLPDFRRRPGLHDRNRLTRRFPRSARLNAIARQALRIVMPDFYTRSQS